MYARRLMKDGSGLSYGCFKEKKLLLRDMGSDCEDWYLLEKVLGIRKNKCGSRSTLETKC